MQSQNSNHQFICSTYTYHAFLDRAAARRTTVEFRYGTTEIMTVSPDLLGQHSTSATGTAGFRDTISELADVVDSAALANSSPEP